MHRVFKLNLYFFVFLCLTKLRSIMRADLARILGHANRELLTQKLARETTQHKKHTGPPLCNQLWADVTTGVLLLSPTHFISRVLPFNFPLSFLLKPTSSPVCPIGYCSDHQQSVMINRPHIRLSWCIMLLHIPFWQDLYFFFFLNREAYFPRLLVYCHFYSV